MKILVITGLYPPYHLGGYEIRNKNIIDSLARRGHEIMVLSSITSRKGTLADDDPGYVVVRKLHSRSKSPTWIDRMTEHRLTRPLGLGLVFLREVCADLRDLRLIERTIKTFAADVIYLGHILPLTRTLLPFLADFDTPIVFDEGGIGSSLTREKKGLWYRFAEDDWIESAFIKALKNITVYLMGIFSKGRLKAAWAWPKKVHIFYNSALNQRIAREKGVPFVDEGVIHSGIDLDKFNYSPKTPFGSPLTIILPGRITPPKGQLDAVRLTGELVKAGVETKLLLVGEKWDSTYMAQIERTISGDNLGEKVVFLPMIEHDQLPDYYHQADVCFFPSYHHTGFSRIPVEAMACGCVVLSYGNEGSDEIIEDGVTGLLVLEGDIEAAAALIEGLIARPERVNQIRVEARRKVEEDLSMAHYVDKIEYVLNRAVSDIHD